MEPYSIPILFILSSLMELNCSTFIATYIFWFVGSLSMLLTWKNVGATLISGLGSEDEERLVRDLFQGYNKLIRPVQNKTQHMNVKFGMALIQLINVNELNQILKTNVWLRLIWQDYQLIWDPADYGNIKTLRISYHMIWTPDIVLFNNADGKYEVSTKCNVVLSHTGQVLWVPPSIYKSTCIMDVRYFPFDEQHCTMKFGSWTFNGDEVGFSFYDDQEYVDLNDYSTSGTWDIINIPGYLNIDNRTRPTRTDVTFHLHIRRKTLFYTANLLAPCIMMSFMSVLVFYLPPDGNEKITLGISILLAIVLFQLVVAKILPPTSVCIPLISKYLLFTFVVNLICVLVTLIIVNWNFRDGTIQPIPSILRTIFLEALPKYLFMERPVLIRPSQSENMLRSMSRLNVNHVDSHFGTQEMHASKTKLLDVQIIPDRNQKSHPSNMYGGDFVNHALVNEQKPPDQKLQMIMALRRRQQEEEKAKELYGDNVINMPGPHHQIQTYKQTTEYAKHLSSFDQGMTAPAPDQGDLDNVACHSSENLRLHYTKKSPMRGKKHAKSPSPSLSARNMEALESHEEYNDDLLLRYQPIYHDVKGQDKAHRTNPKDPQSFTSIHHGCTSQDGKQPHLPMHANQQQPVRGERNTGYHISQQHFHKSQLSPSPVEAEHAPSSHEPGTSTSPSNDGTRPRDVELIMFAAGINIEQDRRPGGGGGVSGAKRLRTFKVSKDKVQSASSQKIAFKMSSSNSSSSSRSFKNSSSDGLSKDASSLRAIARNVIFVADHLKGEDEGVMAKEDWKYIAIVLDRLLLYVFVIVSLAGTFGIILGAPHIFEYVDQLERIQFLTGKKSE